MMADPDYCRSIVSLVRSSKEGEASILVPGGRFRSTKPATSGGKGISIPEGWGGSILLVLFAAFCLAAYLTGFGKDLIFAGCALFAFGIFCCLILSLLDGDPGRIEWTFIAIVYVGGLIAYQHYATTASLVLIVILTMFAALAVLEKCEQGQPGPMALYGDRLEILKEDDPTPKTIQLVATDKIRVVDTGKGRWMHLVSRDDDFKLSVFDYRVCGMDLVDTGVDPSEAVLSSIRSL